MTALVAVLAAGVVAPLVTGLKVVAPPAVAERLSGAIDVVVGEPLDQGRLRRTVELLYATGEFEDVVIETEPSAHGVDVIVRPVPAPRLRGARIEGDAVLKVAELLKAARLRTGEPLWASRLEAVSREAALTLARRSYLEARVSCEARRATDPLVGADLVCAVYAGPRARVGRITVQCSEPNLTPLMGPPGLAAGSPYSRARADRAAERMRGRLQDAGRWRAEVGVRETYDPTAARVHLTFEADPGPLTRVEVRGATIPATQRVNVERLLREGGLRGDVLDEAADSLENGLRSHGHRDALVIRSEEAHPHTLVVVYQLTPGPLTVAQSVRVDGFPGTPPALATRPEQPVRDEVLTADVRTLTRALEERGYAESKIEADVAEAGGVVPVVFRVRTGAATLIREVRLDPTPLPLDSGRLEELRLRVGGPYRARDVAADRSAIASACRDAGHLDATVTPEIRFSDDRTGVSVTFRVALGTLYRVDRILISGLERTSEGVVRRELLVKEHEPLGLSNLLESQKRLGTLGLFERVGIQDVEGDAPERRALVVALSEAPRTSLAYSVGYGERDRLRGSVEASRRNLGGKDRSLSLFARASFAGSRFQASFREPWIFGRHQDGFLTAFREEEQREGFSFARVGGQIQGGRPLTLRTSLIFRYTYQQTNVYDLAVPPESIDRQYTDYTVSGPSLSFIADSRDDPFEPRRGTLVGTDVLFSHRVLGGASFVKGYAQAAQFQRLFQGVVLALSLRVGLAASLSNDGQSAIPLPERFFSGGDAGPRGFRIDYAGPLTVAEDGRLVPTGGNALLFGGVELRFSLARSVSMAVFSDNGNVFPLISGLTFDELRHTAGLGLRYRTPFGPLRLDWGYKLDHRQDPDGRSEFHVTIGHAF